MENQVFNNLVLLPGWKMLKTDAGIILMHADETRLSLIEITDENDLNAIVINDDLDLCFDEQDALTIARTILAMQEGFDGKQWLGNPFLLPITFHKEDLADEIFMLAALVHCWHTPQTTLICGDEEHGYLHHVHFGEECWLISTSEDLELDFIMKV